MLLWNQASADPIRAAEALIKLEAREARLLGLDMPSKLEVNEERKGIPLEALRELMNRGQEDARPSAERWAAIGHAFLEHLEIVWRDPDE